MSNVALKQVWDQRDDTQFRETVVRIAQRIHHLAEGEVHEIVANTMAMLLIRVLLDNMIETICEQEGIELEALPQIVGTGYNAVIHPRRKN